MTLRPRRSDSSVTVTRATLAAGLVIGALTWLASSAPPTPATPVEPTMGPEEVVDHGPPTIMLAANSEMVAVVADDRMAVTTTFRFVGRDGQERWRLELPSSANPRLICVACPHPLIQDDDQAWQGTSDGGFAPVAPLPLASVGAEGGSAVLRTVGTHEGLVVVTGRSDGFAAVLESAGGPALVPLGLVPTIVGIAVFSPDAPPEPLPLRVARASDGSVLALSPVGDPSRPGRHVVTVAGPHRARSVFEVDLELERFGSVAPCDHSDPDEPVFVVMGNDPSQPDGVAQVRKIRQGRIVPLADVPGFYNDCRVIGPDAVLLWTARVSGLGTVDVARAGPDGPHWMQQLDVVPEGTVTAWFDAAQHRVEAASAGQPVRALDIDGTASILPEVGLGASLPDGTGGRWWLVGDQVVWSAP